MHRLAIVTVFLLLAVQAGRSQLQLDRPDYLFGYKTLYLATGMSLHGRFFTLGYMPYRNIFEVESAIELRSPRPHYDSLHLAPNLTPPGVSGRTEPDSNVAAYIGTIRGLHREKFKFIGALFEVDFGANARTWVYKGNAVMRDSVVVPQPLFGSQVTKKEVSYVSNSSVEYSMGPSVRVKITSGRENGEAVISIIGTMDVNYSFSTATPSIDLSLGIMLAPFSYP